MLPLRRAGFIICALAPAFLLVGVSVGCGAAPEVDPIAALNGIPAQVPVGKSLVIPISATDMDGGPHTFKVTSSNARLPARVKTGNPILRVHVVYAGDGGAAAAFEGDLDFQLFRDLAPVTAGYIAGFAQAGYYDNLIFHRVIPTFVAQAGDPAGTGSGFTPGPEPTYIGLPFEFQHEFQPGLLFTGRGQLAMANSNGGYDRGLPNGVNITLGNFLATNGSQFFVTFRQPRHLDFKHTIFGQLIRGFDLLDKIEAVPTTGSDKPTVDVKMASVTVLPAADEATLFIGATGIGDSTITVTVTDSTGAVGRRVFAVRAVDETVNDPPIMLPLPPTFTTVGGDPQLQVNSIDLEFDRLAYGIAAVNTATGAKTDPGSIGSAAIVSNYTARTTAGPQTLAIGVASFYDSRRFKAPSAATVNDPDAPFGAFPAYNFQVLDLTFGDQPARAAPATVKGAPGVALTSAVVGTIYDTDAGGTPATFTAEINWGDGTAVSTGTVSRATSAPGAATYAVSGTHTYAQPGIYSIVVTAKGDKGTPISLRSTAVISAAAALQAVGSQHDVTGATLANRLLATFTDTASTRRAADYAAWVDWGDGVTSRGVVTRAPDGSFLVRGTHAYRDSQVYAIAVRIHKTDADPATDALAWSTATMRFKSAPYLPPFPQTHLESDWLSGPAKAITNQITGTFNPANLMVQLSGRFQVGNYGNRALASGRVRYWLSNDPILVTTGPNADTQLTVGTVRELFITNMGPGASGSGEFTIKLPKGQSGGGKYLLSQLVYSDPIIDHSAVGKVLVTGPIDPAVIVFDRESSLDVSGTPVAQIGRRTSESGGTVTFKVALDTQPSGDVTFPLQSSAVAEGTVAPAELTFTTANWSIPQTVVVTGVNDAVNDDDKAYTVSLKTPVTLDLNYLGLPATVLNLINVDND